MADKLINNQFTQGQVIKGCAKNDKNCQLALYNHFSSKMFSVCLRYAKDYHTAEDILQDAFIKVYKNITKFRGEGSFEGWVRRIFVNTAIEHYRKKTHLYPIVEHESVEHEQYDDSTVDNLLAADILNLIKKLSPGYRTVFNLYVVDGFSHKEIAKQLNISEGTSKSQLARARYILQKMLVELDASFIHYSKTSSK